jgi:hypothetical protein
MELGRVGWGAWRGRRFGLACALGLLGLAGPAAAQAPTALDRLRAAETAGKVKEPELERSRLNIVEAAPLGPAAERPALRTAAAVDKPSPRPRREPPSLRAEVKQRVRDLESCRGGARAGQIQLRWTILPDGRTTNTLVLEQQPTDMDVMKCARKRMDGWRFASVTSGPIDMESSYTFGRSGRAPGDEVATNKKPNEGEPAQAKNQAEINPAKLTETKPVEAKPTEPQPVTKAAPTTLDQDVAGAASPAEGD